MIAYLFRRLRLGLLVLLLLPCSSWAWTEDLLEAIHAVAAGRATPTQQMAVFLNNPEVNLMAQKGVINLDAYTSAQRQFNDLNQRFVREAFEGSGFEPHSSDLKMNPGTDTDINVKPRGGANQKITLEDITKAEGKYQKAIQDYFGKQPGIDKSKLPTGRVDTSTDFMPHPDHVDPAEFKKIAGHINNNGGTMYTDPKAASAQAKLGNKGAQLTLEEAGAFSNEVKDLANAKMAAADDARKKAAALRSSNPGEAARLEAAASNYEYQAAKYHARLTDVNNQLRGQYGLTNKAGAMDDVSRAIANIGRNPYSAAEANMIRSLHAKALQNSADNMIGSMLDIAKKNPASLPQIRQIIAAESRALSAAGAAKAAARLDDAVKHIASAAKWAAFKEGAKNLSGLNATTKFSAVMTAGGAVLIGYQGVQIALTEVKADDTFLDFLKNVYYHAAWEGTGLGPAFEGAQQEEIDKYTKAILEGKDPSMFKHVTFTILKTGVYMGKDAIIGILTLPDTIWEAFTQEKEMEAYAAMQNELARAMRQMILERRAFDEMMTRMKKLGLHDADVRPFLDCLCRSCGGSLGGLYNPPFKGEYGHGPCQCNGPLTIWKTPLPTGNKEVQYSCFNLITKMRYDEAQEIFNKWREQALKENAHSVAEDLAKIKQEIAKGTLEKDEELARSLADQFAAIQPLLMSDDADWVKAMVGPHLINHGHKQVLAGNLPRAVENMDKAIDKVGIRGAQNEADFKQWRERYKAWDPVWRETKEKRLRPIDTMLGKHQIIQARGHLESLEYQMLKDPVRSLPPAVEDPEFVRIKKRLEELQKTYAESVDGVMRKTSELREANDMRAAIPLLERVLNDWEHPDYKAQDLRRTIAYGRDRIARADELRKLGKEAEGQRNIPQAIKLYTDSLKEQRDEGLQAHVERLQAAQIENKARAKQLRDEAHALQQQGRIAEAIAGYKQSLDLWPDPQLETFVAQLEKGLADQQARKAQARKLREQAEALQQQGRIAEAIAGYKQSLVLWPDADLQAFVSRLEQGLHDQQARKAQARQLREQAHALQQQGRITEALAGYKQSLALWPDPELEAFVAQLEQGLADQQARKAKARQLREQAHALQQQGRIAEAIAGYKQSLSYWPDPELEAFIRNLEAGLAQAAPGPAGTSLPAAPTAIAPTPAVQTIGNISGVDNAPTKPSTFTLHEPRVLTLLQTYHWNHAKGATPGTVGLRDGTGRSYGPWRASGAAGQGGVPNAYWNTRPGVTLPPGTYTVIDSDPSTWAQNSGTGGAGHIRVETVPVSASSATASGSTSATASASTPAVQTIGNISGVDNAPTKPSTFTLHEPRVLTLLQTYHWNHAKGATPGTVGLRDGTGRSYGPWRASGAAGQGGVPNAYWNTRPGVTLPPGTYTVIDSDPSTWAQNSGTGGAGHIRVETVPVSAGANVQHAAPAPVQAPERVPEKPPATTSVQVAPQAGVAPRFPVVGRWRTETIEAGKVEDVSETAFNEDGSYTMQVSPDVLEGTAVCTIQGQYSVTGAVLTLRPQGSQCRFKDGTTRSEPMDRTDTIQGPVSGDARAFTFRPEGLATTVRYTKTAGGAVSPAPATPTAPGSTGRTSGYAAAAIAVTAELRNASREAVHIIADGDRYDPANRLMPGEKRTLQITPKADGSVTFQAGRNGQTIASKVWRGVPGDKSRIPVVVFDDTNPTEKLLITTGLR